MARPSGRAGIHQSATGSRTRRRGGVRTWRMRRSGHGGSGYELKSSPVHLLRRCGQYAADLFDAETRGSDLTPRQLTVLARSMRRRRDADRARRRHRDRPLDARRHGGADDPARSHRAQTHRRPMRAPTGTPSAPRGKARLASALTALKKTEANCWRRCPPSRRAEFLKSLALIAANAGGE